MTLACIKPSKILSSKYLTMHTKHSQTLLLLFFLLLQLSSQQHLAERKHSFMYKIWFTKTSKPNRLNRKGIVSFIYNTDFWASSTSVVIDLGRLGSFHTCRRSYSPHEDATAILDGKTRNLKPVKSYFNLLLFYFELPAVKLIQAVTTVATNSAL